MSKIVTVGTVEVNLESLKGLSRVTIDKMFKHKGQEWRDALWSHVEISTAKTEVEKPKKKTKSKKEGE